MGYPDRPVKRVARVGAWLRRCQGLRMRGEKYFVLSLALAAASVCQGADVVLENDHVRWVVGEDGTQRSFVLKASGTELAVAGKPFHVALLHDAKGWHAPTSLRERKGAWVIEFADGVGRITVRAVALKDHFSLALASGVPDGADRLILAQTSLKIPRETVGGYWPMGQAEGLHIVFAALSPCVRNSRVFSAGTIFRCEALASTGFKNIRLAILTTPAERTLDAIEALELRYKLPHLTLGGTWFRRSDELRKPYLFTDLTEANVDEVIRFAQRGGFGYVLTFRGSWSVSNGHYTINPRTYPSGLKGLKAVADKLHAAGLKLGIHLLSACISRNDPYVRPVPDKRLAVARTFTLAADIDETATEIPIDTSPTGLTKVDSYASRGCDLWLGDEIVSYRDYAATAPFRFTRCRRGRYGTQRAAHKAGTPVRYLHRIYGLYVPDPTTDLLPEIAARIAAICNQCGVDMIYFDGGEAINIVGRRWHDSHWVQREVASRLTRDVLITGSGGNGGFGWHTHMRGVSNDGVHVATKAYLDRHKVPQRIEIYHRNLAAGEMGWLNLRPWHISHPATLPDEWEYFCLKALAHGVPVSLHMHTAFFHRNGRAAECLDIIGRYEQARRAGKIAADVLAAIREPGKEFELVGSEEMGWAFQPVHYAPTHRVEPGDQESAEWTVANPFAAQPLAMRLRVRPALQPFGHERNVVLLDPAEPGEWDTGGLRGGRCTVSVSKEVAREGVPSLKLAAAVARPRPGARAWARHEFARRPNLTQCRSIGLWVHGDGGGAVLDVQLVEPSLIRARDYLVPVDFSGWRYVRVVDPATHATFDHELWRLKGNLTQFDYRAIRELRLQLVALPEGKEAVVHVGRIEALRETPDPLERAYFTINSSRLRIPATIWPEQLIELLPNGTCILYDRDNTRKETVKLDTTIPTLKAGENTFHLRSSRTMPIVRVTPILRSKRLLR